MLDVSAANYQNFLMRRFKFATNSLWALYKSPKGSVTLSLQVRLARSSQAAIMVADGRVVDACYQPDGYIIPWPCPYPLRFNWLSQWGAVWC
ncbi:hypothetical protein RRG08_030276 [Elysia crispata]|uniref:Uncharacterized protein n=1 Tax=Elysia crispata TaxID=231223 RepID=A0AAE1AGG9_9GAST|nr:hypothetical protein RRG08_030276 [Elysia crispata]